MLGRAHAPDRSCSGRCPGKQRRDAGGGDQTNPSWPAHPDAATVYRPSDWAGGQGNDHREWYRPHTPIHFSGPVSRTVVVPDGKSESVELAVGDYQIAAEVPGARITPFFGRQAYQSFTHYWLKFYTRATGPTQPVPLAICAPLGYDILNPGVGRNFYDLQLRLIASCRRETQGRIACVNSAGSPIPPCPPGQ